MALFEVDVTSVSQVERAQLGPSFTQFAVLATWARQSGVLEEVADRLRLSKKGGYQGIDIFLFLLAFFATQRKAEGLHGFANRTRDVGKKLARLGERKRWPTQASVSRSLATVSTEQASQFGDYLLQASLDLKCILHHESVMAFDAEDEPWHVFDFDPTKRAIRQRALAESEELFEPKRGGQKLGEPGYNGRKRGELMVSRPMLQHRGSRLGVGAYLHAGTGRWGESVNRAFKHIEQLAEHQALKVDRCLMCVDGEEGGWTQVRAGIESPVHFLTRLTLYRLLEPAEVRTKLEACGFQPVSDAGSGPRRQAAEFGTYRFEEGQVRLIVSRFRHTGSERGAGVVIDGWHYEVFATDLGTKAWSAADVVTLFFGRNGQENYFAIEDRELDLDRTFSQEPGGQLLACLVGLWLWNIQIVLGWESLDEVPERHDAATLCTEKARPEATKKGVDRAGDQDNERSASDIPTEWPNLPRSYWVERFEARNGWSWDDELELPVCPAGYHLRRLDVRDLNETTIAVRFRARRPPCRNCPMRSECTSSKRADFRKEISLSIEKERISTHADNHHKKPNDTPTSKWTPPDGAVPRGRYEPRNALLKPQVLRQRFTQMCWESRVYLDIREVEPPPPVPDIFVVDRYDRQRRRQRWSTKLAWNALNTNDRIHVRLSASPPLQRVLAKLRPPNNTYAIS